jgi:cysteinyl-tRNA synthetase
VGKPVGQGPPWLAHRVQVSRSPKHFACSLCFLCRWRSVMASELLGSTLDVHGGGVDLKFPHHDNEMAQAEAYWDHHQCVLCARPCAHLIMRSRWVHYFLHTGHLHIEGRKMSKSLKNFLTIREVLEQVTPRQLRLLFLMQSWRDPMNYSQGTLTEMLAKEKTIREFMLMVKTRLRDDLASQHTAVQRWNSDDEEVHKAILETEKKVRDRALAAASTHPAFRFTWLYARTSTLRWC